MNDFIVNFCLNRGFQPKNALYINLTPNFVAYAYVDGEKTISVKESLHELFR